jgi:tetratricopeptide (TPR) repeat protein
VRRLRPALLGAALLAAAAFAGASGSEGELGKIDFATSGTPEAQAHFLRGALLLHSFEYDDAAAEFRQAQQADPGFAMAYWGEAMTFNHPLWMERNADGARQVLGRLGPTPDARAKKAPTRREKMYLEAVEILYAEGEKGERDRAYAEAMRGLYEQFPDDFDAASFYALALLGTCEEQRDVATYMRAAAIVEEVFARNPRHPGAAHYLIHSYDDPIHAPLGMRSARVYAQIAPAATHALHMPSHIFLALGMWDRVVASNEASWKASVDRAERLKLSADAHSFHALSWLGYAYLQQGRWKDARRTLATMEADARATGSQKAREHLVTMRAAYLAETGQWGGDAARIVVDPNGLSARNLNSFIEGLAALEAGDRKGAEAALARMKEGSGKDAGSSGHAHGGGGMNYGSGWAATDAVLSKELEARILFAGGRTEEALALAREAVAAEDAMSFEFGPPDIVKPSHEMLGEMLLASNRPAEAQKQFEASLARAPRRAQSLLGLARAASKAGDTARAASAYADLRLVWSGADADVAGLQEVRRSASGGS